MIQNFNRFSCLHKHSAAVHLRYGISYQRRQLWTAKLLYRTGKFATRTALGVGGVTIASATYLSDKIKDWGENKKRKLIELIEAVNFPKFGPNFEDFKLAVPNKLYTEPLSSYTSKLNSSSFREKDADTDAKSLYENGEEPLLDPVESRSGAQTSDIFSGLMGKIVDIKSIMRNIEGLESLSLPSIVVIGSQSSGKSSLLEAIVGHEFLPKGRNMATRRPIEITLINTPETSVDYAELPQHNLKRIEDFSQLQELLTELNQSGGEDSISEIPIDIRIYSSKLPDLTMIDLPGYISVTSKNQSPQLKSNIINVCRTYIQQPNIILAVSASDVDLANSVALNESRLVDPEGLRTLGVLTKMDLVNPKTCTALLDNQDYPLELGYVGVVCKSGSISSFSDMVKRPFMKSKLLSDSSSETFPADEQYFMQNYSVFKEYFGKNIGISCLRTKLSSILQNHLSRSARNIYANIREELEEARYQYKVQFNDSFITPESYATEFIDELKHRLRDTIESHFSRKSLRQQVEAMLNDKVIEICKELYWKLPSVELDLAHKLINYRQKPALEGYFTSDKSPIDERAFLQEYRKWNARLERAHSALSKSHIGRTVTDQIVENLQHAISEILGQEPFSLHPETTKKLDNVINGLIKSRYHLTVEQVENSIKPLKFLDGLEATEQEWNAGIPKAIRVIENEIENVEKEFNQLKSLVGRRKLRSAMQYLEHGIFTSESENSKRNSDTAMDPHNSSNSSTEMPNPFSERTCKYARQAIELQHYKQRLQKRIDSIRPGYFFSSICGASHALRERIFSPVAGPSTRSKSQTTPISESGRSFFGALGISNRRNSREENKLIYSCQAFCPETHMVHLSRSLAHPAATFIHLDLISNFLTILLTQHIDKLLYYGKTQEELREFCYENEKAAVGIKLHERVLNLESVASKLESLLPEVDLYSDSLGSGV